MEIKKSKSADLEPKKSMFMQLGLIVSLSLVFTAFEWKSYDYGKIDISFTPLTGEIEEMAPPVIKEPELPKPPVPQAISFVTVDNTIDVEDKSLFTFDDTPEAPIDIYVPIPQAPQEQIVETDDPFIVVEDKPQFPGGEGELLRFLATQVKYPQIARETNIQGTVYAQFVIEKNGKVSNVKVMRGIGGGCDEEAVRVLRAMPDWTPGKQRGMPVRVMFTIPVSFKLN
jgi:protein TonB